MLTNRFRCYIIAFVEWKETHTRVGVFSDEGPPVPIPNTEVKLISADNTWLEAAREDKAMPTQAQVSYDTWAVLFAFGKFYCYAVILCCA